MSLSFDNYRQHRSRHCLIRREARVDVALRLIKVNVRSMPALCHGP
jgi:hypothetical protein